MKVNELKYGDIIFISWDANKLKIPGKWVCKAQQYFDKTLANHVGIYVGNNQILEAWDTGVRVVRLYSNDHIKHKIMRYKYAFDTNKLKESVNKYIENHKEDNHYPNSELYQVGFSTFLEFFIEKIIRKNIEIPIFKDVKNDICSVLVNNIWKVIDELSSEKHCSVGEIERSDKLITVGEWEEKWTY